MDKQLIAGNLHTPRTLSGRAQETHLSLAVGRQTALVLAGYWHFCSGKKTRKRRNWATIMQFLEELALWQNRKVTSFNHHNIKANPRFSVSTSSNLFRHWKSFSAEQQIFITITTESSKVWAIQPLHKRPKGTAANVMYSLHVLRLPRTVLILNDACCNRIKPLKRFWNLMTLFLKVPPFPG